MGNKLILKSQIGEGTEFSFALPFRILESNGSIEKIKIEQVDEDILLKDTTILVVEDEPKNVELLNALLDFTQANIINVNRGIKTIQAVKQNTPDLVLMGIRMPGMDGLEATKQIKEIDKAIPIIVQTSYAMKEDKELCIEAGCDGYISKSIRKQELFSAIKNAIL